MKERQKIIISMTLPFGLIATLDRIAGEEGRSRSNLVTHALTEFARSYFGSGYSIAGVSLPAMEGGGASAASSPSNLPGSPVAPSGRLREFI